MNFIDKIVSKYGKRSRDDKLKKIGEILITDIHSHILPAIDDGAESLDESVSMVEALISLGYKKAVLTPHVMSEGYQNSSKKIQETLDILNRELKERSINISLGAAAEYYMDEGLISLLKTDDILTLCGNHILFETSYLSYPLEFEKTVYEMRLRGYKPMIAHPERYRYIGREYSIYEKWRDMGISFQVEINSFNGRYGKEAFRRAVWLSKKGWIDYLGTDAHSVKDLIRIEREKWRYPVAEVLSSNSIKNAGYC